MLFLSDYVVQAEKRAHHNALERKRRDHIKESFLNLRDAVPSLQGERTGKGTSVSITSLLILCLEVSWYCDSSAYLVTSLQFLHNG